MPSTPHLPRSMSIFRFSTNPSSCVLNNKSFKNRVAKTLSFRCHHVPFHSRRLLLRNGSGRPPLPTPLERHARSKTAYTKPDRGVQDTRYSHSPFLKSMLGQSHLQEQITDGTPLELEILRSQHAEEALYPATRVKIEAIQQRSRQADIHATTQMQAQNLGMLDYYDDTSPTRASASTAVESHESITESTPGIESAYDNLAVNGASVTAESMIQINATLLDVGLRNPRISRQLAFDLYRKLPSPGVLHLKTETRNRLLGKLSQVGVTEKDERAMMQYLSVFDDLHSAGITAELWQWAAAMHLSGRCFKIVTISELESAMRIWKRMEGEAGVRSNTQTMNILLDIALKAHQLDIADLTLAEMRRRKLKFDRVTYLGLIYLKGLRGDGDGVRKAYKDFVLANEVVDTMTLTCVMSALLKAGELPAATNLYRRMLSRSLPARDAHQSSPQHVWEMGRLLTKFAPGRGMGPSIMAKIQGDITVAPNIITYVNLIGYHAKSTGEMVAIAGLLDDMHAAGIPMHGSVFTELFRGFSQHGNKTFTSWTKHRLEEVWRAFKGLADSGNKDIFVGPVIAVAVLEAFRDCYGKHRASQVLEELRQRWRKLDESHEFDEWWLKFTTGIHEDTPIRQRPEIGHLPGS